MTTTIGIKYKDGIILAADRQVSSENFVASKYGEKIYQLDKNIGITIAGLVADAVNLVERLKAEYKLYYLSKKRQISIDTASQLASKIFYSMFRGGRPLFTQILLGGITDIPKLYVIDPSGGMIEDNFISTGSGSQIAYGTLENGYKPDLTEEEAIKLAYRALKAAVERNPYTGGKAEVVIISKKGFRKIEDEKLLEIVNEVNN
ncbi:MAG: proteasome subunit beta [Candidatus Helarchaeota archaeon]